MADAELLAAIRVDLGASPFVGEGHRKGWARLRIIKGIRVSRARVLRLIRENQLLSPHRQPKGDPNLHDGTILTDRPNEMWGPMASASRWSINVEEVRAGVSAFRVTERGGGPCRHERVQGPLQSPLAS